MADASKTNRARIFGQWGALKILHPQIAPALNEIEELSSTNPQQAKEKWTSLIENNPTLPESLFHNLQWAAFEEGQTTEEKNEEQESTEEHEAHKRHLLHPESTLDTEEDKVYEDANLDPAVEKAEEEILRKANADPLVRQATSQADFKGYQKAWDASYTHHDENAWDDFVSQHPQKAEAYALKGHEGIKKALDKKIASQIPQKSGKLRVARNIIAPQIPLGGFVKRRVLDNKTVQKISKTAANTLFPQAFLFNKGKERTRPFTTAASKIARPAGKILFPQIWGGRKLTDKVRSSESVKQVGRVAGRVILPQRAVFNRARNIIAPGAAKIATPLAKTLFPQYFLGKRFGKFLRRGRGGSGKSSDKPSSGVSQALGPGADVAKQAAQQLAQKAAVALFSNPVTWIVLGVILLILIIVYIIMSIAGGGGSIEGPTETDTNVTCPNPPPVTSVTPLPGVTLTLNGPGSVQSGEDIPYSLSVLYDESVATTPREKVVVYDFIPTNTTFVSASGTHEMQGNAILWELSKNQENSFNLILKPTTTNICIVNVFSATNNRDIHRPEDDIVLADPSDYQATIKSEFGIQMEGFTPDSLKWAYDTLKSVSNTKFIGLQKGHIAKIFAKQYTANDWESNAFAPGSDSDGCQAVIELVQGWPAADGEEIFKITLIHEISHVIDRCAPETEALGRNHQGPGGFIEVYQNEGGATYYGQHAKGTPYPAITHPNMTPDSNCPGGNPISEDYADMLAYYLFPASKQKNICKNPERLANPYDGGAYEAHYKLAEKILKN